MSWSYFQLIIALPLLFGVSVLMTFITYKQLEVFFIWMVIIGTFLVYVGMIPFWILVILLIISITLTAIKFYRSSFG